MLRKIKQKWSWFKCLLNPKTHFVTQKEFVNQFSNSILDRLHENNRINERISDYDFRLDYLLKENKKLKQSFTNLKITATTTRKALDKFVNEQHELNIHNAEHLLSVDYYEKHSSQFRKEVSNHLNSLIKKGLKDDPTRERDTTQT